MREPTMCTHDRFEFLELGHGGTVRSAPEAGPHEAPSTMPLLTLHEDPDFLRGASCLALRGIVRVVDYPHGTLHHSLRGRRACMHHETPLEELEIIAYELFVSTAK